MGTRFDGRKALVTGAGKGIGNDIAKAMVEAGAEVYALSRTQGSLDKLKAQCPSIHTVCCDLNDWDLTRSTVQALGPIDLLVNNAGVSSGQTFMETTPEEFDKVMNVNVKAVINVSQVVIQTMIDRGSGGSIVNISSQASQRGLKNHTSYCASKGALDQLTRVMAAELGEHKIRVNAVCPTVVLTDMGRVSWTDPAKAGPMLNRIPLGRFAEISDVTAPVLFLLSDAAAMIHGAMVPIDGGFWAC